MGPSHAIEVRSITLDPGSALAASIGHEWGWLIASLEEIGVDHDRIESAIAFWQQKARQKSGFRFAEAVVDVGLVSAAEIGRLIAARFRLPFIESGEALERRPRCRAQISASTSRRLFAQILDEHAGCVHVGIAYPTEGGMRELEAIVQGFHPGLRCHFSVIAAADLQALLVPSRVQVTGQWNGGRSAVESLLGQAIQEGASDVHFIPRERCLEVKFRIDGCLWTRQLVDAGQRDELIASVKMFGNLDVGKRGEALDGASRHEKGSETYKLRFSSMPTQYGQHVVMRILNQGATALPFDALGMGDHDAAFITSLLQVPQGLIFLVGPTGCGKSTTLASLISRLDGAAFSVRTLENPIEYKLANAIQTEISNDLGFAEGLRALLRQDPDYILVGETRDRETAEIAIEAGLTGHLCFSTLHANDAIGGVVRLLDLGVEVGPMLAACKAFVAQRLVRRLCRRCAIPHPESASLLQKFGLRDPQGKHFWQAVGCPNCRGGYRGRVGVFEVRVLSEFADIIQKLGNASEQDCRRDALRRNLPTMQSDGLEKALQGLTTVEELKAQISF